MAKKSKVKDRELLRNNPNKQVTSIGRSRNTRPKNKHKKKNFKSYRGQGR